MTIQSGLEIERVNLEMYNIENNSAQSTYAYFMEFWKYKIFYVWMNEETTVMGKRGLSVVELGRLIHINEMVHLDQFKYKCIFIVNHDSEVFFTPIVYNCFFYYNIMYYFCITIQLVSA